MLRLAGESEANVDPSKYSSVGDPNVRLTERGRAQAAAAGDALARTIGARPLFVFVSPYMRTRETAEIVVERLAAAGVEILQARRVLLGVRLHACPASFFTRSVRPE